MKPLTIVHNPYSSRIGSLDPQPASRSPDPIRLPGERPRLMLRGAAWAGFLAGAKMGLGVGLLMGTGLSAGVFYALLGGGR